MNWRDLKPGDCVRVTLEANVYAVKDCYILLDRPPEDKGVFFSDFFADAAKWELLPKPLRVGRAKYKYSGWPCDVLAIHDDLAWVRYDFNGRHEVLDISKLINIDEEPTNAATWEHLDPPLRAGRAEFEPPGDSRQVLAKHVGIARSRYNYRDGAGTHPAHSLININEEPQP